MRTTRNNLVIFDSNITQDMIARRDAINRRRAEMVEQRRKAERNNKIARVVFYGMVISIMVGAFDVLTSGNSFRTLANGLASIMGVSL